MKGELLLIEGLDLENNTMKMVSWFKNSENMDIVPTPALVNQYINLAIKSGDSFEITKDDILRNIKIYKTKYVSREKTVKKYYKNNDKFNYIAGVIQGSKEFAILNLLSQAYNIYDSNYKLAKELFINAHVASEIPLPISFLDNGISMEVNFDSELLGIKKVTQNYSGLGTTTSGSKTSACQGGSGFDKGTIPTIAAGVMNLLGTLIGLGSETAGNIVSSTGGLACTATSGYTNSLGCEEVDCSQFNQVTTTSSEEAADSLLSEDSAAASAAASNWYESPLVWVGGGAFLLITILLLTRK